VSADTVLRGLLFLVALILASKPLGVYVYRVMEGVPTYAGRLLGPVERSIYRWCRVDSRAEMNWKEYFTALLIFNAVGAAPDTLALLVNRRLLRIEERLDVRRVELTHDVLCGVVKSSRDLRREREAREATERLLAEQHSRELSARRALVRARQIAIGCTVLAVGALTAAVFAYFSGQRAHRAELEAQQTRAVAEQARSQAEHLLGYLTDDFVREL